MVLKQTACGRHIECKEIVSYRWRSLRRRKILAEHLPLLDEEARDRIAKMRAQGAIGGELHLTLMRPGRKSTEVSYVGWWEVQPWSGNVLTPPAPEPGPTRTDYRRAVRRALADYIASEGCSCCRREDEHRAAAVVLAKLLGVPPYPDGSGYDFHKFKTEKKQVKKK